MKPENGVCSACAQKAARRAAGIKARAQTTPREQFVRWRYGMEAEDLRALEAAQGGLCAICRNPPSGHRALHVDHDHETGRVRGLLCHGCNTGLGAFGDSADRLDAAISYLAR